MSYNDLLTYFLTHLQTKARGQIGYSAPVDKSPALVIPRLCDAGVIKDD